MRFYRNHIHTEDGESRGYRWFPSRQAAEQINKIVDDGGNTNPVAEPIVIEPTKAGILLALNRYASHADNG